MTDAWRADAAAWWGSDAWHRYEEEYGDEPGARVKLLAQAEWRTRLLDLTLDPSVLLHGMTKGRRSDIRQGERLPILRGRAADIYLRLRSVYQHGARSLATYASQLEWIESGHAVVAVASRAAVFCIRQGTWGYYASKAGPVDGRTATALWRAILMLREHGVTTFELGWQGHAEAEDRKGQRVEAFIRHFGGVDVPARLP